MTSTRVGVRFGAIGLNYSILGPAGMLVQREDIFRCQHESSTRKCALNYNGAVILENYFSLEITF